MNHVTRRHHNATFCQLHEMSTDGLIYIFLISIQKHYLKNGLVFADQIVMSGSIEISLSFRWSNSQAYEKTQRRSVYSL